MSRHHHLSSSHHSHPGGAHELGQNYLRDRRTIGRIVELARPGRGPIVEWGTGDGALSVPLAELGRSYEGVEIDPRRALELRRRLDRRSRVTEGDILRHAPPKGSTLVSNVPFHITTPVLRRLFRVNGWQRAVLLVQWEVARKRAGVGGATQMTAENWPWFEVRLDRRVPARAFRPMPSVDGGILVIERRSSPLLSTRHRGRYRRFVRAVFTGRGHGIAQILSRNGYLTQGRAKKACAELGIRPQALPRDLDADQWAGLFMCVEG